MIKILRKSPYSNLHRSIYLLFVVQVINSLGTFVIPFLTLFLTQRLGIEGKLAGMYVMIASLVFAPGSLLGGKLADQIGRKNVFIIFQLLAALCFIVAAFMLTSPLVPWILILANLFTTAILPAIDSMVADLTKPEERKSAFSLLYLGYNVGVALGYSIAGFLFANYIKLLFFGEALAKIVAVLVVILFLEESFKKNEVKNLIINNIHKKESFIKIFLKKPEIIFFAVVAILYSFVFSQHSFGIPLHVNELFPSEGAKVYGIIMTFNSIVVLVFTVLITQLTDKYKAVFNMVIAGIFFAIGFGLLYFAKGYLVLMISTFFWTMGRILDRTNTGVFIANSAPEQYRGRFNAVLLIISGAGYAIGPAFMGVVINNYGFQTSWKLIFVLSLVGTFFMYLLFLNDKKKALRICNEGKVVGVEQIK
ncbi:MAG: MFS transporter [Halanaerobiales bacterium]|nr:MFS transporter [Halanaerobiales bacterium]